MNTLLRCALAGLLSMVCGCRANVSHQLLERELLAQENQIYQLQDLVEEYESRLDSCHRENEALLAELGRARTPGKQPAGRATEEMAPPVVDPGSEETAVPFNAPLIAPPDPKVPEGEHMAKGARSHKASLKGPAKGPGTSAAAPIDQVVTRITLNRRLTGGHNIDGQPGDEGVLVVVEPLNESGDLVEVPGAVRIVLLDPAFNDESARVARWDFTSAEAARYLKRTPMGDGLHFELRWPHSPPVHRVLNLYVRYTTADGRRLELDKQIEVDPPGDADKPHDRVTEDPPAAKVAEAEGKDKPGEPNKAIGSVPDESAPGSGPSATGRRGPHWAPYR